LLPRLQTGKQRPERFARLHQTGIKMEVISRNEKGLTPFWFDPFSPFIFNVKAAGKMTWEIILHVRQVRAAGGIRSWAFGL
jgi:hypothetical protein